MYVVITSHAVLMDEKLENINKKLNAGIEQEEMLPVGPDFVTRLDDIDIDFVRDKKRLSGIFFGNFFKRDNRPWIFALLGFVFTLVNILITSNVLSTLESFIAACGG